MNEKLWQKNIGDKSFQCPFSLGQLNLLLPRKETFSLAFSPRSKIKAFGNCTFKYSFFS
jgi:hypothetical protein